MKKNVKIMAGALAAASVFASASCGKKQSEGSVNHIEKIAVPTGGTATFLRKR